MRPATLFVLLLCCLPAAAAFGQLLPNPTGTPTRSEQPEGRSESSAEEPAAFAIRQIPGQIEQSRELARRATEAARPSAEVGAVREQMAAFAPQLDAFRDEAMREKLARADLRSLEAAEEQVITARRTVTAMQATLGRRSTALTELRGELSLTLRSWGLTAEVVQQRELPEEILGNVRTAQELLRAARKKLSERQQEILAFQGTLDEWLAAIDERGLVVEGELARARLELFRPDYPPLWKGLASPLAAVGLASSREAWLADWRAVRGYVLSHQGNAWVHLALLIVLLAAFATLARKVGSWIEDKPDLARPLAVFRHPLAAALVLAILAGPWIYPDAPSPFRELNGLLLILPLLRVLPAVVTPSLRGALYLLAGLYVLLRLNALLGMGTTLERATLLILAAAAAAALAWTFRPGGPAAKLDAGRWWRAARFAARIGLLILAIALLANIGGLVSLSSLLTNGVVSSAFVAIVLFASVVVIRAGIVALFQTGLLQHLNLVRWHGPAIDAWLMRILQLLVLAGWLVATARQFRVHDVAGKVLGSILYSSASIGTVQISLADVLGFIVAIWLGVLLSRFLRFVLSVDVFPRVTLPRGVAATISMLVNYTVLGIAFVLAVAAAGIQLDRFALIVGALSVGIGFGMQNIVNNFVSGLILAFERPIQAGDTIEFGNMFGRVGRIGVRSSTVRTFDGAEVIVPNGNLISNEVTNWTLSDKTRRMEILVGVAYGSNPHKVLELLLKTAQANESLLSAPPPTALFLGFGDSSLDFSLRCWTDDFDNYLGIKSALTLAVHDALQAAEIEIPFPQRDLHLRSVDARAAARLGEAYPPSGGDSGSGSGSGSRSGSGTLGAGAGEADAGGSGSAESGSTDGAPGSAGTNGRES
jgi:potassium-dependent mechanosensitive channel